jgi:hypothetical protein
VQVLATAAYQHLPLAGAQLAIAAEVGNQRYGDGIGPEPRRRLAQAAGQESAEALTAAHQIREAPFGLQLQSLLQGAEPGVGRRRI